MRTARLVDWAGWSQCVESRFAASALQTLWPLLGGLVTAIAFYVWHWHRTELEALSPELVSRARKTEVMGNIALLLAVFLN